jgi:hypothetical protein
LELYGDHARFLSQNNRLHARNIYPRTNLNKRLLFLQPVNFDQTASKVLVKVQLELIAYLASHIAEHVKTHGKHGPDRQAAHQKDKRQ